MNPRSSVRLHTYEPVISDGAARLLIDRRTSLVATANSRLWIFSPDQRRGTVVVHEIGLDGATAVTWDARSLWVASAWQVWRFVDAGADDASRAEHLYLPQLAHTTGYLAVTDMAIGPHGPVFASGLFSCLAELDDRFSMRPLWVPPPVTAVRPETRSLLTGVAVDQKRGTVLTAAVVSDHPGAGETAKPGDGVVLSLSGSEIMTGLSFPLQPRWHDEQLIVAEYGTGRLLRIDPYGRTGESLIELPGPATALDVRDDLALVGFADPRRASLPYDGAATEGRDGLSLVDLTTATLWGTIEWQGHAGPIEGVALMPDVTDASLAAPRGLVSQSTVVTAPSEPLAHVHRRP